MKRLLTALALVSALAATPLIPVRHAEAALGEPATPIAAGRRAVSPDQRVITPRNGYSVQEIGSGATSVREYVAPSGIVFAIVWNGVSHPDLTPLMGSYVTEYQQALRQAPRQRGQRRFQVRAARVIVEKWGHMRNLQGRAYVPALIPEGVSIDEIK